ncbi:MAG: hypothetical protein HN757_07085 [Calditrichaeota bacterium]|jgi:hypothetical protein|nr:hypothetical protein [Calditrichota bacterium]
MFESSEGYKFDSLESYNALSDDEKRMIYWMDLYKSEKEREESWRFFDDPFIESYKDKDLLIEIYQIEDFYLLVKLNAKDNNDPEVKEIEAFHDLIAYRQQYFTEYWKNNIGLSSESMSNEYGPKMVYKKNTIFADLPYKTILKLISKYLESQNLYESDDGYKIKTPLIEKWTAPDNNSAIVYASGHDDSYLGSGYGVYLYNSHYFISHGDELPLPIPKEVINRTDNLPHFVQIESSGIHEYPQVGFELSIDIANHINKNGGKAYIFTSGDKLIAIKNDENLSIEERVEEIHAYALNFDSNENIMSAQNETKQLFLGIWKNLEAETKQFLTTGIFLYKMFKHAQPVILDTAPASIEFAKCFEKEISSKLLQRFKEYFAHLNINEDEIDVDLKDRELSSITRYLVKSDRKPPELGTFAYFLNIVIHSKKRIKSSATVKAFVAFSQTLTNPQFILDPDKLLYFLRLITTKYRNGAAHTEPLTFKVLDEFYILLSGRRKPAEGLLTECVTAILTP